jgi:hypothetical protein
MALKNFIKENFVLALGLTLPVLLVAVFLFASIVPKHFATPPQYKLLLSSHDYSGSRKSDYGVDYIVKDGKLFAKLMPKKENDYSVYNRYLLIYDGKTDSIKKIDIELPEAGVYTQNTTIPVSETEGLVLDTSNKAPDGYAYTSGNGGGRGIASEIFGGGYRYNNAYIKKGMVSFKLPVTQERYYYNNLEFLGWITDEKL